MSEAEIVPQETAIAVREQSEPVLTPVHDSGAIDRLDALTQQLSVMDGMWNIAQKIARTPFANAHGNNPENVFAAFMKGHEVGLQPMQALDSIDVIQGKPTLKPETMRALIRSHGHDFEIVEQTAQRYVMRAHRKEWVAERWSTFEFTMAEARDLKLDGKDNWKKQPAVMLFARCTGKMARAEFADVLKGLSYTPDEILDSITVTATPVSMPAEVQGIITQSAESAISEQPSEDVREIQKFFATASKDQKAGLKEWWKLQVGFPKKGSWPSELVSQLNESQAQKTAAECSRIATAVLAQPESETNEKDSPPPSPEDPSAGMETDELNAIFRDFGVGDSDRPKVAGRILNKNVADLGDLSAAESERVADRLLGMSAEAIATLVEEVS